MSAIHRVDPPHPRVDPAGRDPIEHLLGESRAAHALQTRFDMSVRRVSLALTLASFFLVSGHALAKGKGEPPKDEPTFDRAAAASALGHVDLVRCKVPGGPRGQGHVKLTFEPEGTVSTAVVDGGPYVKSPVERCISAAFKTAKVPAFKGAPVTLGKAFRID